MNTPIPPNCLKVIFYSENGHGSSNFEKTFDPLTNRADIMYNDFFNYVRNHNKKVKMVLTACTTTLLNFNDHVHINPYYVRVSFSVGAKNELAGRTDEEMRRKNIEFIVPTTVGHIITDNKYYVRPAFVQWINLPKSNKNIGIELESFEIFTNRITVSILNSDSALMHDDEDVNAYDPKFMVEFWLYYDD